MDFAGETPAPLSELGSMGFNDFLDFRIRQGYKSVASLGCVWVALMVNY